jgi:VCBS repeat-containing protein
VVTVDLRAKSATVKLKEGATVSRDLVVKAFDGSKFKVTSFDTK